MGPLAGTRVIELKGIGPGPYAGMLLADMGADVIVVERSSQHSGIGLPPEQDIHSRGKRSIAIDLKHAQGVAAMLRLVDTADVLLEGNRPGVAERLGFGPDDCFTRNPRLVYGRVTGWGQSGPLAGSAGHDINYIALTGALAAIGGPDRPVPPLNLVGDYAGGSLFLVVGVLAALLERQVSGKGQVIDAAITDGTASLMSVIHALAGAGSWQPARNANLLDGGAHFYNVYETSDGRFVAVGAIEPQFYALLMEKAGIDPAEFGEQLDASNWAASSERLAQVFRARSQAEWRELLEGTDACFAPVLDYRDAPGHPHHRARGTYLDIDGLVQPAPAPRFSRSAGDPPAAPKRAGEDTDTVLAEAGFDSGEIDDLRAAGALG